jgi:hypothetical protein
MRKFIVAIGVAVLTAAVMPASVSAKGGAQGATLLPTLDAITCTAELTVPNCESDGFGAAATLKIGRANYLGIDVSNLITGQTYLVANNDVGLESCAGVLGSFSTGPAGGQTATFPVDSAAGFVSICREVDAVLVPVLTGEMGPLNGR